MSASLGGGYDDGYTAVPCLWGTDAGSLVEKFLQENNPRGLRVLDVGAGEGKNAAAFARMGAIVDALECSSAAIGNGRRAFQDVMLNWIEARVEDFEFRPSEYNVVISYGLTHCMPDEKAARRLLDSTKAATKPGGHYILVSFNNRDHDLIAHPGFAPLLLPHGWFLDSFADWRVVTATDTDLYEVHPHNGIPHHHSMTRLVAQRI